MKRAVFLWSEETSKEALEEAMISKIEAILIGFNWYPMVLVGVFIFICLFLFNPFWERLITVDGMAWVSPTRLLFKVFSRVFLRFVCFWVFIPLAFLKGQRRLLPFLCFQANPRQRHDFSWDSLRFSRICFFLVHFLDALRHAWQQKMLLTKEAYD